MNSPITLRFEAMRIVTIISGTETTPLMTADQKSARMGFSPTKFNDRPTTVATARHSVKLFRLVWARL